MDSILEQYKLYLYISSKANTYTPAKTIYVVAPGKKAETKELLEAFAIHSGWVDLAEEDGAVLVMPIAKDGWDREALERIPRLYDETRQKFKSKNGDSIPGRDGFIWCWETLVYLVGYEDGAVYAGNLAVKYPNRFAGVVLVNGVPNRFDGVEDASDHWLVRNVSKDYRAQIKEIPVCLWLFTKEEMRTQETVAHFLRSNQIDGGSENRTYGAIATKQYTHPTEPAHQIRVSTGSFEASKALAATLMSTFFNQFIRWKNSPDGTPEPLISKEDFYKSGRFRQDQVLLGDISYDFFAYFPEGFGEKDIQGLPVVFSAHGRGEPSWIFATKNGWDRLADEMKEFIVIYPDSPQNMWFVERDGEVFGSIINKLFEKYRIDRTRVYLTGFSNGGMITRQVANIHPELFAAISPWSAPFVDQFEELLASGYELPCTIYVGDNDDKVPLWENVDSLLENMLMANGCELRLKDVRNPVKFESDEIRNQANYYTKKMGYKDGDRLQTFIYRNREGRVRVGFTLLKNMPHGAIYDQSRATWAFMKRYRRPEGSRSVEEIGDDGDTKITV